MPAAFQTATSGGRGAVCSADRLAAVSELKRLSLASLEADVALLGANGDLRRWDRVTANVAPLTPDRSIFNGVAFSDPEALVDVLDEIEAIYDAAGVNAWTVWVPEEDRSTIELLQARGHVLDGTPRAMALWLEDLADGPASIEGIERASGSILDAARINDIAYDKGPGFAVGLEAGDGSGADWHFAADDGELVACLCTVTSEEDVLVSWVATLPEYRGRGIASWLLREALLEARASGARSASLRASALGSGVYARLGFLDHGCVEMWEKRRGSDA
jgi:GNAT superfamily N-acetyltransferase